MSENCQSCPRDFPSAATHIANAYGAKKDGSVLDWPVCAAHLPFAMVAGWFPIRPASADTHPKGGDSAQTEAPAPLSGAVGGEADETPKGGSHAPT